MSVWTFLLHGGLNQIIFLRHLFDLVVFAFLAGTLDCTRNHLYAMLLGKGVQPR